ncbi:MAG: ATP-binding protein [Ferruginibacter sp.]
MINIAVTVGQPLRQPIRYLSTKDGLPQSFISGLVQDKEGFVWISTRNGLASYDGIKFKIYRHTNNDTATLASNLLIKIAADKDGSIWIEHESGDIDRLDPSENAIEHITNRKLFRQQPVRFIKRGWLADSDGNLWCHPKNDGLYLYDWNKNKVTHYPLDKSMIAGDTLRGFMEDSKKQLWVLTEKAFTKIDLATGSISHIYLPFPLHFNTYTESDADLVSIVERSNGEIIFSDPAQLVLYNPSTGLFKFLPLPVSYKAGIRWMHAGPDGNAYFEIKGTVYRYTSETGISAVADVGSIPVRDVQSFMIDRSGLIWLGINAGGIYQVDLAAPFFESHLNKVSFHSDLLLQEMGTNLKSFSQWPAAADSQFKFSSYLFRSAYDASKNLWIGLRNQVGYYSAKEKQLTQLPPVPFVTSIKNSSLGIRGIDFSPDGRLWVAGYNGYTAYYDAGTASWQTFLDSGFLKNINLREGITHIAVDANNIWLSSISGHGLFCVDIKTKTIRQFTTSSKQGNLPSNQLLGLLKDPSQKNILWIGSYEGLIHFNTKTLQTTFFSINEGLPDNTIYSLQFDDKGFLWLSTNKGLCRFDTATHNVNIFQLADGLPGDEFNRFHHLKLPDGRMAFGGTDGWVLFNPLAMKTDTYLPQVAFTGLKINNIPVDAADSEVKLSQSLNVIEKLSLRYNQNTLSFSFAGLEFTQPQKIRYRYKLEGYDNDWIVTGDPEAVYTKLPPGNYVLYINATNTTGEWSDKIKQLAVTVSPPVWRTWWAYLLYLLIAAGWIALFIRYRVNRERLRQEVLLKEKEAAQLKAVDELKSRFFSNITHDFRTPLTLILGPAQQLKTVVKQETEQRWLDSIERNANQLLTLINQLLDLSRLEAGSLQLNEEQGSPVKVIENVIHSFRSAAESKGIILLLHHNNPAQEYWFDAAKLQQVVNNLVANALKFTAAGGTISVNVEAGERVVIAVSDTGIGIPTEKLPYIFNRFFQVDGNDIHLPAIQGSGIGLALVKELVELQGGTISADSKNVNTGKWSTVFSLEFPYRKVAAKDKINMPEGVSPYKPAANNITNADNNSELLEELNTELPTVLLVEDNTELGEFVRGSIGNEYTVIYTADGKQGLDKAFDIIPDLVISDVMMPVMDGYELCDAIKRDERTNHIPVMLLTAKVAFDDRIEGLKLGADDYLTKPFHVLELQLRIRNLIERQQKLREKIRQELGQPGSVPPADPEPGVQDAFLAKLYSFIEENLDKTSFGVEDMANLVGMSRASLHRKLKAVAGMSAGEIIRTYRLKRAAEFLRQGHSSSETAYMTGFDSPAYFSKSFKDFYNLTPIEFAQNGKN